ncbi:uncharacterized protein LOC117302906 [Asterias rubens]|uniref:uncharacterized protein LOC117302906 n=1 Tax=Asterias rubens TaxID=7604 RepID=UPI001455981D|nr:uncharacterized protein LOC117302906 [Asterias rubens]
MPPTSSIADAHLMSPNKRISVQGLATTVSPVKVGDNWSRKEIQLKDPRTSQSIRCKLWGNATDLPVNEGTMFTISNLEVAQYHNVTSTNSTAQTAITEIEMPAENREYIIQGFDTESNPPQIITQDDVTLNINIEQLVQLAPRHQIDELQGALPLTVELVVDLGTLTVIDINRGANDDEI